MQTLETIKSRSQASVTGLVEKVKAQPTEVKTWGVTAGSAAVGAVGLTAVASGVLAVLAAVAVPPVALTVGAVGGGLIGWNYMRSRQTTPPPFTPPVVPEPSTFVASPTVAETLPAAVDSASTLAALPPDVAADVVVPEETSPSAADTSGTEPAPLPTTPGDELEVIRGIGPVYAGRLRAAGVATFADLAALTPERVHEIIGNTAYGQTINAESWIAEAQQLSTPQAE